MANIIFQLSLEEASNALRMAIESLIEKLEEANTLPVYMQNIGLALLAILVPLAIAILTEVYRKKGSLEEEFAELDLHVILDDVFRIKLLIIYSLLMFIPYVIWDVSGGFMRLFEIIVSIIGTCLILKTIYDVYHWTKGNVFRYRFSYLKKLKNPVDLEVVWRSVWKSKNINIQNEKEFFKIFSSIIENKMKTQKRDLITVSRLLNDYLSFIKARSVIFLVVFEEVFPKILDWKFTAWKKEYEYLGQRKDKDLTIIWGHWFEISRILDSIIKNVEERAFEERHAYLLFEHLQRHINAHKSEYLIISERNRYYIKDLLDTFYQVLFEKVPHSPERFDVWDSFPNDWKVTKRNIENKENLVARFSLDIFLNWAQQRIMETREDYDWRLDNISYNLFPEVDPKTWAVVLIFVFSPYGENRVKSVIERQWTFGLLTRTRTFSGVSDTEIKEIIKQQESAEITSTYELATLIFGSIFTKELLEEWIEEAKALKYASGSEEERKRLRLIELLQGISDFLKQKGKHSN